MAEINNEKYASNSYKSKAEKEVQKVVKGNAKVHQKTRWEKAKFAWFGDGATNLGDVIPDLIIPAIKDLAHDVVINTVDTILFGEVRGSSRSRSSGRGSYVSYDSYSRRSRDRDRDAARRARFDFSDIEFDDPTDIDDVIDELVDAWDVYREVTVAQFYTSAGIRPSSTDNNWGWTNIRDITDARVSSIRVKEENGEVVTKWILNLPKPRPLN